MGMNWLDFIYLGPTSIWFLGGTVLLSAIVWMTNTKKIISELKSTTSALSRGVSGLEGITSELRKDTSSLTNGTSDLKEEMARTRISIDNFYKTLRRVNSFWFPFNASE